MKKGFILYNDFKPLIEKLTDAQAGVLLRCIFDYQLNGSYSASDPLVDFAMTGLVAQFQRDNEKWHKEVDARKEAGRKGGLAKASKAKECLAKHSKAKQSLANLADSVSVSVSVTDKDSLLDNSKPDKSYSTAFRVFWESYPKKMSQELAWQAFKSVTVPVDVLIKSVKEHAASEDWKKEKGKFIPFPHNFLASKRWTDELPAVEKVKISDWNQDCCNHKGQPVNKDNLTLAEFCKLHKLGSHAE